MWALERLRISVRNLCGAESPGPALQGAAVLRVCFCSGWWIGPPRRAPVPAAIGLSPGRWARPWPCFLSVAGAPQRRAVSGGPEETLMIGAGTWCLAWWSLGTESTFHFFPQRPQGSSAPGVGDSLLETLLMTLLAFRRQSSSCGVNVLPVCVSYLEHTQKGAAWQPGSPQ